MNVEPCPYCDEPISLQAERCPFCGERLVEAEQETTEQDAQEAYDIGKVVSWPLQDPNWTRHFGWGVLHIIMSCLLVPSLALVGYKLRIARQQAVRPGWPTLPSWDDWWGLVVTGFRHAIALCMLPLMAMILVGSGAAGLFLYAESTGNQGLGVVSVVGFYALALLLSLVYQLILPAVELEFLETDSILASLDFGALLRQITAAPTDYLLLVIFYFLLQMLGSMGAMACYVGMLFTLPWMFFAQGALIGRFLAVRRTRERAL